MTAELEAEARERYFKDGKIKDGPVVRRIRDITDVPFRFNRLAVGDRLIQLMVVALDNPKKLKTEWKYALFSIWRYRSKVRKGRSSIRESKNPYRKTSLRGRGGGNAGS